jgi:ADP-ribose pyrophosphatase YjhB (NUDIX family)
MPRAQSVVTRNGKILIVKHQQDGVEWWCLPGGAVEKGETPQQAAIRELAEECNVRGRLVRRISLQESTDDDVTITYLVDIGDQEPVLGSDPEFLQDDQVLVDLGWRSLDEIPERDRVFLWAAGLVGINGYIDEVESWGSQISYPQNLSD